MKHLRSILGFLAGALLILSSAAHSLLGWSELRTELLKVHLAPDLIFSVGIGWHFGGLCMFLFGAIPMLQFGRLRRHPDTSLLPSLILALGYLAFGSWTLVASHWNPFFAVFLVPGALLLIAAWWPFERFR